MKKYCTQILQWSTAFFMSLLLLWSPVCSALTDAWESLHGSPLPPVIFTEVLTGTKTSGTQEFIELYNTTDEPIDLTGWQVWYLSAQAASIDRPASSGVIMLGDGADSPIIGAHEYYVLSGRADYLGDTARQFYAGTMAATGGNLRLVAPDALQPCMWAVQDQLGWGNALYAQGTAASAPPAGQSLSRAYIADSTYIDTQNNATDFTVTTMPSPKAVNTNTVAIPATHVRSPLPKVAVEGCVPPPPPIDIGTLLQQPGLNDIPPAASPDSQVNNQAPTPIFPSADIGLVTPQITELLPNPAAPKTDAQDEFIELYNSNVVTFDLSGFSLEIGTVTKHHFVFPAGTTLAPQSFTAFFSGATGLSMSNSGGQVRLLDPYGVVRNQSEVYGTAKDGQAWVLIGSSWSWTSLPTPGSANSLNVVSIAAKKSGSTVTASTKVAPATKKANTAKISTPKTKQSKPKANTAAQSKSTATITGMRPLHPAVLAMIAGFALLYGLYEYRQDLANKFYQFRANRATRRTNRAEAEGG